MFVINQYKNPHIQISDSLAILLARLLSREPAKRPNTLQIFHNDAWINNPSNQMSPEEYRAAMRPMIRSTQDFIIPAPAQDTADKVPLIKDHVDTTTRATHE